MRLSPLFSLVGVLAAPALALADTPAAGQVVHSNDEDDQYFNQAECEGTATLEVSYLLSPAIGTNGVIRWFVQDREPVKHGDVTMARCYEEDTTQDSTTTHVIALNPPGDIPAGINDTLGTEDLQVSLFAGEGEKVLSCTASTDTVFVCAHFYPFQSGTTTPSTTPTAVAWGKLILDTREPATPTGLSLRVGDTRLYARWGAGSGGAAVGDYRVVATRVDGTGEPRTRTVATTKATIDGLENDVEYTVEVFARSVSGTPSADSVSMNGIPRHVKDFWELYEDQGGQEEGGCGGPAGPLALLGLAGLAALLRAGRRS